jgi:hypothetical protein
MAVAAAAHRSAQKTPARGFILRRSVAAAVAVKKSNSRGIVIH